ncbi:alkyl hydroperoxide reductase subunit D [Streptosporangium becharense]|uniref:Alkyl hydroperoxide reductase AhpD n=1 Tax=Streptosporangium becharense TaxID=1816182 RepID=A0A7W9IKW1_9ACTN|nr:carboxymuconolactone decarboxylase family protein [Streptosporangium becharense]MBB2911701.1 alkyl hydroperoxide reductase subunit D [Streptosporangium becharense]MBB5822481.1 alkyl hydroperoxide reductase subunit D [Streptosporangium becharense]
MSIDNLKGALPDFAKDIKLNLGSLITTSSLSEQQLWGTLLACATATKSPWVITEISAEAAGILSAEAFKAARAAAAIMAMNNVYYRSMHLIGDETYATMPAKLRMSIIGNPGVDKTDFELWSLAVSAIGGCGRCLESHEQVLRQAGMPREQIQEGIKIAAVVNAVATVLDSEAALASV